ncbi:MAG: hypothetical protein PHF86_08770 [Candidatus Nanoarchaeia archaeon]|nr:hypothetical protein [Candidatus Nanoarchaeia archaeon]
METKDMVIVGLVVLLVLTVAFSTSITTTGNAFKRTCSDSDNGNNPFVKGTIAGTDAAGNPYTMTDYCSDKTIGISNRIYYVKEYYCDMETYSGWNVDFTVCENGCSDGACIQ